MEKGKHGTVLLVDDDLNVLTSTTKLLRSYEYNVLPFSNVNDAIINLRANNIDVVVTDIVMPHLSGIELLTKVHEIDPQIPVILVTAYADMDKMINAIKMGAFDFIIKPINIELFIHSIEKAARYNKMLQIEEDYKHLLEDYNQEIETLVAERTMSLMALTVADKIRNPAAIIGLTCKRLLDKDTDSETLRTKLHDIINEADKLDTIVINFETLLKSKKYIFKHEFIDGHIENVISINIDHANTNGIEITFIPSEHPVRANIQKNLFQLALSHLIKNSIEATPEGGRITVSTRKEENDIVISISDTGQGINQGMIDKVFDPMFSTKDRKFGMGLSLVKQIVVEHMGEISVESKAGEGTTFTIRLPVRWTES